MEGLSSPAQSSISWSLPWLGLGTSGILNADSWDVDLGMPMLMLLESFLLVGGGVALSAGGGGRVAFSLFLVDGDQFKS